MPNTCGRCWRWWRQRGDRAAKFAGDGSCAGSADLDGQRSDGHALRIRSPGGTCASGHWREPPERTSVCVPFASRRSFEDLVWDRDGFVLWYKRLEVGVFKIPRVEQGARSVELRASELAMILDGIDVSKLKRVPRYQRAIESCK